MATNVTLFTCPMCGENADDGVAFRDHLAGVHQLVDDPGTDTLASLQPASPPEHDISETGEPETGEPEPAPSVEAPPAKAKRQQKRSARAQKKPAAKQQQTTPVETKAQATPPREPSPPREPRPRAASPKARRATRRTTAPSLEPPSRYPLALRYGDIALYVPAFVLFLIGVFDDHIGLTLTAVVLAVVAMLLPVAHAIGMGAPLRSPAPGPTSSPTGDQGKGPTAAGLEETLLTLPRPSADERPDA